MNSEASAPMINERPCRWCGQEARLWFRTGEGWAGWACARHWGRYMCMPFRWEWIIDLERNGLMAEASRLAEGRS